ncbi:(2Fe-2S)-binding protein [Streptomyces sp. NBC_00576]|uniref:(2Fe-2S)-binding protein n=1 Tax=Streptomyces sp. NBC_00576 TaxID=2903665 RepID=UPI002E80913F|nr:(2Fe-2S)-binding protein [Streptomyces sp. NBC_00576]WUB69198.1 (2Fe-2S)-binding protein [Streptomyces sp. NBC_00576]
MSVALETPPAAAAARVLGGAYKRLADVCEVLTVQVAEPAGKSAQVGVSGAELTESQEALDAFVEAEAVRIRERYGHTARPHVAASRALHDYAWSVGLLMSGVWYLERRVPRIRPEDVRLDLATGVYKITPASYLSCLPGDPAATLPGVTVLPHEEALRAELRSAVADHMAPLLTALGPIARRGSRALWGLVSDDLVSGIWYLGRVLGREGDAVRAATELLPSAVSPYPGGADFRHLTDASGRRHPTRTRAGCCLYYTIRPDEACSTCPRTCDTERLRRLES